jgi:hypothetical protein
MLPLAVLSLLRTVIFAVIPLFSDRRQQKKIKFPNDLGRFNLFSWWNRVNGRERRLS